MSEFLKVSGKKFHAPAETSSWKFTVRPGGWILAEGPAGERRRFAYVEGKGRASAAIGGQLYFGEWVQERKGHGAQASGGDSDLTAQFPGKVRKVLVEAGAKVEAGTPLILIEAMKMEFTVKAPANGTVKRALVTEGQQLSPGDRFFEFEEAGEGNNGG
jgi:3-methylcrotonyl-CoA carboxylase alpha subunit